MKNRDKWGIIRLMLRGIRDGDGNTKQTRTRIMYETMLSNDQMKEYLDFLQENKLVKNSLADYVTAQLTPYGHHGEYKITEKGLRLAKLLDGMHNSLPFIDVTRKETS